MTNKEVMEIFECYGIPCSTAQLWTLLNSYPQLGIPKKGLKYTKPNFRKQAIDHYIRLRIGTDPVHHRLNLLAKQYQRKGETSAKCYDRIMRIVVYKLRLFTTKQFGMLCILKSDIEKVRGKINELEIK